VALLTGTDPHAALERQDKNPAVPGLAAARPLDYRLDCRLNKSSFSAISQPHFFQQVGLVDHAAAGPGKAFLSDAPIALETVISNTCLRAKARLVTCLFTVGAF
jgi:hypothetical protein